MVEVLVVHEYLARKHDELTIRKGDIIREVVKKSQSPGWLEGVLDDKRGSFPDHCVTMKDNESGVVMRNKKDSVRQCRVIFSYTQDHEDELNIKVGDIIDILGEEEEGWWRGFLNGKEGVFPSNFVQEIVPPKGKSKHNSREDLSNSFIENEVKTPVLPPKPAKTLCEVKFAYKSQHEDELSLKEGDIITLISKDAADAGWWRGELNGKIGVFPDNFVVIIPNADVKREEPAQSKTDMTIPIKHNMNVSQRTSLNLNEKINNETEAKNPPIPSKKPYVPIKKSPSSSGGIFQGLRKKLENIDKKTDVVDGGVGSKVGTSGKYDMRNIKKEDENQNAFDQVERNSLLKDVRAQRAKPPVRRPPTNTNKDDSNEVSTDSAPEAEPEVHEIKPQVREWEKHKAPWLEEMKMNQAKRSSTSPGPENKKIILPDTEESKNSAVSDKDSPVDMSKSMPSLGSKKLKSPQESEIKPSKPTSKNILNNDPTASPINYAINNIPVQNSLEHERKSDLRGAGDFSGNDLDSLPAPNYSQYAELVQRVATLETLIERQTKLILDQNTAIDELRGKLTSEVDKRKLLQSELDKVAKSVNL